MFFVGREGGNGGLAVGWGCGRVGRMKQQETC